MKNASQRKWNHQATCLLQSDFYNVGWEIILYFLLITWSLPGKMDILGSIQWLVVIINKLIINYYHTFHINPTFLHTAKCRGQLPWRLTWTLRQCRLCTVLHVSPGTSLQCWSCTGWHVLNTDGLQLELFLFSTPFQSVSIHFSWTILCSRKRLI